MVGDTGNGHYIMCDIIYIRGMGLIMIFLDSSHLNILKLVAVMSSLLFKVLLFLLATLRQGWLCVKLKGTLFW